MQVDVRTTPFEGSDNGVKGFASVTFCGAFTVSKVSIVENHDGHLFVSMQSYKTKQVDENGKALYKDICNPITKDFREKLYDAILDSYREHKPITLEYESRDVNKLVSDTIDKMEARDEFPFAKGESVIADSPESEEKKSVIANLGEKSKDVADAKSVPGAAEKKTVKKLKRDWSKSYGRV